jgi:hypothetical protein
MKALRAIENKGGLDKYILRTSKRKMDSKLGNHLKSTLISKILQVNSSFFLTFFRREEKTNGRKQLKNMLSLLKNI